MAAHTFKSQSLGDRGRGRSREGQGQRQKLADFYIFEATLVYIASTRLAKAT